MDLEVKGHTIPFKLDTGAEVTAITEQTYHSLGQPKLNSPSRVLYRPARQALCVLGELEERLSKGDCSTVGAIYVIKGLKSNLLSLQMLTALQLVRRVDTIHWEQDVKKQFSKVFQGLGVIGDEYKIKLKEDATPYALQVPRNVPIPLRPKVKEELDRMEKIGVISRVDKPTD